MEVVIKIALEKIHDGFRYRNVWCSHIALEKGRAGRAGRRADHVHQRGPLSRIEYRFPETRLDLFQLPNVEASQTKPSAATSYRIIFPRDSKPSQPGGSVNGRQTRRAGKVLDISNLWSRQSEFDRSDCWHGLTQPTTAVVFGPARRRAPHHAGWKTRPESLTQAAAME
jgi:hypothetical protein